MKDYGACWVGGARGGWERGRKRFVLRINFWTTKTTEIFLGSGSGFCRLNPLKIISNFFILEKDSNLGKYLAIEENITFLSSW